METFFGVLIIILLFLAAGGLALVSASAFDDGRIRLAVVAGAGAVLLFAGMVTVLVVDDDRPCANYGPTTYIKGSPYRVCEERYEPVPQ